MAKAPEKANPTKASSRPSDNETPRASATGATSEALTPQSEPTPEERHPDDKIPPPEEQLNPNAAARAVNTSPDPVEKTDSADVNKDD